MREVPDCLNRRYKALNDLIEDITTTMPACMRAPRFCYGGSGGGCSGGGGPGGGCHGGGGPGGGCPGAGGLSGGGPSGSGLSGGGPGGSCSGGGGPSGGSLSGGGPRGGSPGGGGPSGGGPSGGSLSGGGPRGGSPGGGGPSGGGPGGGGPCSVTSSRSSANDEEREVGIKLMCDFWKILQDDPDCNLTQIVQDRLCEETYTSVCSKASSGKMTAARSGGGSGCSRCGGGNKVKYTCVSGVKGSSKGPKKHSSTAFAKKHCCPASAKKEKEVRLHTVLGNINQAASFERKCSDRVSELVSAQKDLTEQISKLEAKEKRGVALMKKADYMWSCMEDEYKQKLAASQERYRSMQNELKEIEASTTKWRKNKKDLEFQLQYTDTCSQGINEKIIQKENDVKVMELEIEGLKKRIASIQNDLNVAKNSYTSKKSASDARQAKITKEMENLKSEISYECQCKADKENEGIDYLKESRDELQTLCRCLLQKKLENEDLLAEKEALLTEIGLLKVTYDTCAVRCAKREENIVEETKRIDKEISEYTVRCIQCHKQTDSSDVMGYCIDCPRCLIQRECLKEGDHCSTDHAEVCICTRVKEKFVDNVFENMYTVLERQVKTCPGKEMADCIFHCLKRSRNGKLDEPTRKILQDFVLSTVKKNLNLTIVGGAVKTRCEMDPDTYRQLMLCLKDVAVTRPLKQDKYIPAKKPPCKRWPSSNECNCPNGPRGCPCITKVPKLPSYHGSCGKCENEVVDSNVKICPQADSTACGVDCGMLGLPGAAEWRREPCAVGTCPFAANMRAAQCVLGPDALANERAAQCVLGPDALANERAARPTPPVLPHHRATCISGGKAVKSDTKNLEGNVKDDFNEGTTPGYQKTKNKNHQIKMSLSDASPAQASLKPISSLQKAVLFTDEQQPKILEEFTKNNLNQNENKEQFQIVFKNSHGQSDRQFTELTQTPSGKLVIELDEKTIKIIEEKSVSDPYLYMSIKTSNAGHVLVDFNTKENVIDKTHRVKVRQTSSGTKLLDIHKNMIRTLKNTLSNKIPDSSLSKSIKLKRTPCPTRSESPIDADTELPRLLMSDKDLVMKGSMGTTYSDPDSQLKDITGPTTTDQHMENISGPILTEKYMKHKNSKELKCICPKTTPDSGSSKLMSQTELMLKNEKKTIPGCSCDKSNTNCRIISEFDSTQELIINCWNSSTSRCVDNCNYGLEFKQLYKQRNANVAVEIQVKNGVLQKLPAVVTKTDSGTIAIYVRGMSSLQEISSDGRECPVLLSKTVSGTYFVRIGNNDQNFNATLIKTPSEGVLLIPQSFQEKHQNEHEGEDFYEVKLSVLRNQLLELPAVLKPTSSKNYLVVLDKEFEKCYIETLREYFGDNLEGSVDLNTTNSGNYILELGNEDETNFGEKNAMLVKTSSGHIKVLVHGPEFESLVQRKFSISSTSSAQALAQMDSNLPASSREFHSENLRTSNNLDNHTSSKTKLFGKVKERLPDSLPLVSKSSTVLKTTPSGQYAVLLNEESKKSLLNNLQSNSLTSNKEGLVPIKRLDSGEIIINLGNKDEGKSHYGTLKVTPSGTFYVVVDEKVMKDLTESFKKNEVSGSAIGTRSKHATQLIDSVHKSVAPICQAKSDDCCCDPSTCVCTDRLFDTKDGSNDKLVVAGGVPILSTSREESDRIVFEPSYDSNPRKNAFDPTQQCFYWLRAPHHQPCSDNLSSKLIGKSEFSQPHEYQPEKKIKYEANSEEPAGQNAAQVWDSLDYLPPQLPYFLKDVRFG